MAKAAAFTEDDLRRAADGAVGLVVLRDGRHGFVDYGEAFGFAEQIHEAVRAIARLIDTGEAVQAMHVAREALRHWPTATSTSTTPQAAWATLPVL